MTRNRPPPRRRKRPVDQDRYSGGTRYYPRSLFDLALENLNKDELNLEITQTVLQQQQHKIRCENILKSPQQYSKKQILKCIKKHLILNKTNLSALDEDEYHHFSQFEKNQVPINIFNLIGKNFFLYNTEFNVDPKKLNVAYIDSYLTFLKYTSKKYLLFVLTDLIYNDRNRDEDYFDQLDEHFHSPLYYSSYSI